MNKGCNLLFGYQQHDMSLNSCSVFTAKYIFFTFKIGLKDNNAYLNIFNIIYGCSKWVYNCFNNYIVQQLSI